MGKLADKSDRIGQQDFLPAIKLQQPGNRIQRREQLVLRQNPRACQGIQESRLPGIRVADNRRNRCGALASVSAEQLPVPSDILQLSSQLGNPPLNEPSVSLQLLFARSPGPDATSESGQLRPNSGQPRHTVLQLRHFHLDLSLGAGRPLRKNIQDQKRPVHHLQVKRIAQIAHLSRRKLIIRDHAVCIKLLRKRLHFLHLSTADVCARLRILQVLNHRAQHFRTGGIRKRRQLIERVLLIHLALRRADSNQNYTIPLLTAFICHPIVQAASFPGCLYPAACVQSVFGRHPASPDIAAVLPAPFSMFPFCREAPRHFLAFRKVSSRCPFSMFRPMKRRFSSSNSGRSAPAAPSRLSGRAPHISGTYPSLSGNPDSSRRPQPH